MSLALWIELAALGEEPAPASASDPWPILFPGQCTPDDPHFDLEVLYYEGKFQEGLSKTDLALKQAPDKDLYWLKTRFMFELGELFPRTMPSAEKEAFYQEMVGAAEAGLKLAPQDPHLRFGRGLAMGRLGTTRGVLSSLFMAKGIEADWLAITKNPGFRYSSLGGFEVLPCEVYIGLGIYYRLLPDWWIIQVVAGTRGSLDTSLEWNLKATQCKPTSTEAWKELGVTQLCIGQRRDDPAMIAAGTASLRKCQTLDASRARSKSDVQHCGELLADPSLACAYSRDGQQDLDQSKLAKP